MRGGRGEYRSPEEFDPDQVRRGIEVEMEHTDDPRIALQIALDHLDEHPRYYDFLGVMERLMEMGVGTEDLVWIVPEFAALQALRKTGRYPGIRLVCHNAIDASQVPEAKKRKRRK